MNKKGFTLVELLAVMVILGVLGSIAVVSYNKYLIDSRDQSYEIMSQTVYEGAMNCMVEGKCFTPTTTSVSIKTSDLVSWGYLKPLKNPLEGRKPCYGTVVVSNANFNNASEYQKYQYKVSLTCEGLYSKDINWPKDK